MTEIKDLSNLKRSERVTVKFADKTVFCQVLCANKKRVILSDEHSKKIYHVQESHGTFLIYQEHIENNLTKFLEGNVTLTH